MRQTPNPEAHTPVVSPQERISANFEQAIYNEGFDQVATLFGVELSTDKTDRLAQLQKLAAEHFDFRKGAERQQANFDDELLDQEGSEAWQTVFDASTKLGLVESSHPERNHYDFLMVTGAANRAPLQRLQFALEQGAQFDNIVMLGCSRPVSDAEREKAADYAPNAQTEYDLMAGAAETALGLSDFEEYDVYSVMDQAIGKIREYKTAEGQPKVTVLSAFPIEGGARANTGDTYRVMHSIFPKIKDKEILMSTNAFYTAFQHIDAQRLVEMPSGARVETIGFDAEYGGVVRKPAQLLQEIKSYVDALARLQQALEV